MRVGIDSLNVHRFESMERLDLFLKKYFTEYERTYIKSKNQHQYETMAGIYVAKEAFLKAVEWGIRNAQVFLKLEVKHKETGAPYLEVKKEFLEKLNIINTIDISITHTSEIATAICIIE